MAASKTQIDRLGDRLKAGAHTEDDLRLLDEYRRSFGVAYEAVIQSIRQLGEFPTGRLAKSTLSIVEKLRRESLRLSQMQDIAGCRVVVRNVVEQDRFVESLRSTFPEASVMDRRSNPSNGYRAIHIIAEVSGKPIEIQVRTSLQHLWAEVSEKSSDVLDPKIKYGGGSESWRNFLTSSSISVAKYEEFENQFFRFVGDKVVADATYEEFKNSVSSVAERQAPDRRLQELRNELEESARRRERADQELRSLLVSSLKQNTDLLTGAISWLDELKGRQK